MPVGTNGTSIYRPHNTPPGTVCTGDGIGIQIRNDRGDVIFVLGIDDGKIYFGDVYADPNIPNVVLNPPPTSSSEARVTINGIEYVSIRFIDQTGSYDLVNIRADLWETMKEGGIDGAIASWFVAVAIGDMLPDLIGHAPDLDGDGDRDFHDWAGALEQVLRDQQLIHISNGDNMDALAYDYLANTFPDIIGDLGNTADSVTTDDNQPPPGGDGGGGGNEPPGDTGWLF
jgi:hypothetical protein